MTAIEKLRAVVEYAANIDLQHTIDPVQIKICDMACDALGIARKSAPTEPPYEMLGSQDDQSHLDFGEPMTDKLTPAQECAVELYKSHNTPIKRLLYLDSAAILNESGFPVYDVEIISRYIREAEQRGYDQASRDLAGVDGGDDVHYRPEAPHD